MSMITEDDVHRYFWSVALAHGRLAQPQPHPGLDSRPSSTLASSSALTLDHLPPAPTSGGKDLLEEKKKKKKRKSGKSVEVGGGPVLLSEERMWSSGNSDISDVTNRVESKKKEKKQKVLGPETDPAMAANGKKTRKKKTKPNSIPIPIPTPTEQERLDEEEIDELLPSSPVRASTSPPPPSKKQKRKRDSSTFDSASTSAFASSSSALTGAGYHCKPGETRVIPVPKPVGTLSALPPHLHPAGTGTGTATPTPLKGKGQGGKSMWPTWATSTPEFMKKRKNQQVTV